MPWRLEDFEGSLRHAARAVQVAPENAFAQRILGTALLHLNRLDEAERHLRRALELQPGFPLAELDLAFTLLLAGRMAEGWRHYEARWRDGRVARPALFQPEREWPGRLGVALDAIPSRVRYLRPPEPAPARWSSRLQPWSRQRKVGLAWCSTQAQVNNRNRSMPHSLLRPFTQRSGVQCFSLQKGDAGPWTEVAPDPRELVDLTPEWSDFGESAAMIEQLDLVITVDTAIAHLAGALGKPVWILLPPNAECRMPTGAGCSSARTRRGTPPRACSAAPSAKTARRKSRACALRSISGWRRPRRPGERAAEPGRFDAPRFRRRRKTKGVQKAQEGTLSVPFPFCVFCLPSASSALKTDARRAGVPGVTTSLL